MGDDKKYPQHILKYHIFRPAGLKICDGCDKNIQKYLRIHGFRLKMLKNCPSSPKFARNRANLGEN